MRVLLIKALIDTIFARSREDPSLALARYNQTIENRRTEQ